MQNMDHKDLLLKAMREAGEPLNAGRIAELSGVSRKTQLQVYPLKHIIS